MVSAFGNVAMSDSRPTFGLFGDRVRSTPLSGEYARGEGEDAGRPGEVEVSPITSSCENYCGAGLPDAATK